MQITIKDANTELAPNSEQQIANLVAQQATAVDLLYNVKQSFEDWQNTLLRTSNEGLYGVLAKCLRVYEMMTENSERGSQLRTEFNDYLKSAKLKFNGDTHTVNKIARIVFEADRKKSSAYGIVLRAAIDKGVGHADLVEFIQAAGGIEAIRLARTGRNAETTEDKAERAWAAVKDLSLAVVKDKALAKVTDQAKIGSRMVLLATQKANGEFVVHAVLEKDSAVNAAFAAYASQVTKDDESRTAEAEITSTKEDRAALRAKAAEELLAV